MWFGVFYVVWGVSTDRTERTIYNLNTGTGNVNY